MISMSYAIAASALCADTLLGSVAALIYARHWPSRQLKQDSCDKRLFRVANIRGKKSG
jgi:hypothetical protein